MAVRRLIRFPVVVMVVLAACLAQVPLAAAAGLNVRDDAGVLTAADQRTIREDASRVPFSVYVWTVKGGYGGNKPGFVVAADALVTANDTVIIAVDTTDKFTHIAARNARLSAAATTAAKSVADPSFAQGQWGAGVIAAIGSLTNAAGAPRSTGTPVPPIAQSSSFPWVGLIVLLVVLGAVVVGVRALLRSRQQRGMAGPQGGVGPGYGPVPGGGQPGYGPGYGPGSGGGGGRGLGGMLAGGALGGLGGGLLGYELGKEAGERQEGSDRGYVEQGQGGYADPGQGGFVESDQGDGGADWGGGSDSGGGGSDF